MKLFHLPPRRAAVAVAAVAASCLVAACGSSSSSSSTTKSASASASASASTTGGGTGFNRTAFRTCLEQHGVKLSTPPAGSAPSGGGGFNGGGFFGGGGGAGGQFRSNPKFQAAFKACGGRAFRGGAPGAARFRISHTAIDNFVACVRTHGFPQMPSPNFSGTGSVFPANIRTNSKFQAASRQCASILIPARPTGTSTTQSS